MTATLLGSYLCYLYQAWNNLYNLPPPREKIACTMAYCLCEWQPVVDTGHIAPSWIWRGAQATVNG